MSTTTRQPAGTPVGGQFTTSARTEATTALTAGPTSADRLTELARAAFPQLEDAHAPWVISRVDAQRAARAILADLSDDDFFNDHWFGIESAAILVQRFANDADGEEADTADPADTLGVELLDFQSYEEPDRAGEAAYVGYDFPAYARAITEAWEAELGRRVTRAVAANDAVRAGLPARGRAA